ncbi:2-polyprenyl-6-hydroxyphenyl methylase / 3-demethylubiquinone-9 3-methyltransferase [Staphylococcus caledonicus]|uniref:class I SAM-dependent methyltransferase n=1 Tax=Staphylococcus TaxID=1279 RepID=UPI001F570684|nr:class I SAM-dependent methyltransferase [Staphylococcus sp. acrmy]MCI2947455.1 class I SAM-dependent methyltransferase [Staphylococcus sp. acrmy]
MDTFVSNNNKWELLHKNSKNKKTRIEPNYAIKRILSFQSEIFQNDLTTRTLEIGCGFGRNLKYLIENKFSEQYFGIDLTQTAVDKCSETLIDSVNSGLLELKKCNVGKGIQFPDKYFNCIFDIMSPITFITDEKERIKYFTEIYRILKDEGSFFFLAARKEGKFIDAYNDSNLLEKGYIKRKIDDMIEKVYTSEELINLLYPLHKEILEVASEHTRAFGCENFIRENGFWFGQFKKHSS